MSKSKGKPRKTPRPAPAAQRPSAPPARPVSNPELKKAMAEMKANDTPQTRNTVLNLMMRATFLAPVKVDLGGQPQPKPDANGRVQLPPHTKFQFTMIGTQDGKQYLMAFTDAAELKKWNPSPQSTVLLSFDDYAHLTARNPGAAGLVIDPYGANLRFDSKSVASLKQQKDAFAKMPQQGAHRIDPGAKVVLLDPSVMPDALLDPLCQVFQKQGEVKAAYLQIMVVNDTDKSYLLVLDAPQSQPLFQQAALAAQPFLREHKTMNLDITTVTSPMGAQVLAGADPFYTRERGRIYDEDDEED